MAKVDVIEQEVRNHAGRSVNVVEARRTIQRGEKGRILGTRVEIDLTGNGVGSPQRRNYVRTKLNERLEAMGVVAKFTRTSKDADVATLVVSPAP